MSKPATHKRTPRTSHLSQPRSPSADLMLKVVTKITLVMCALVSGCRGSQLDLVKDIQLEIQGPVNQTSSYPVTISALWGVDPANNRQGQTIPAILDVSFNYLMLAQRTSESQSSFGITCENTYDCEIYGPQAACIYSGVDVSPNCQDAGAMLQFQDFKNVENSAPTVAFKLFSPNEYWVGNYSKNGVFGLGPLSPFWNYLNANFTKQDAQQYIEVSVAFKTQDTTNSIDPSRVQFTDSYLTVNGRFGINEPVVQPFVLKSNQTFGAFPVWVFSDAQVNYQSAGIDRKSALCVDNTANAFFISADAIAIKRQVSRQLCNADGGCVKSNSTLSNVKPIKISFSNSEKSFSMQVTANEFINFDPDTGAALIGIVDIAGTKCALESGFNIIDGVGRLFLTKVEFIVRIANDNSFQIGFNEISYPNDTLFLIVLLILAFVILAIIVGIMIVSFLERKRTRTSSNKTSGTETNREEYFKPADS